MADQLISVSQICIRERDQEPKVGIVTNEGVTFYTLRSIEDFVTQIKIIGEPTMHGSIHNGVYKLDAHVKQSVIIPISSLC